MTDEERRYVPRLFLQNWEREEILRMVDWFKDQDVQTEDELEQFNLWTTLLSRLVFGKQGYYPIVLQEDDDEG